jgi:hypothetical protein
MHAYIRIFICVVILYIVSILSTYNYSRKEIVENIILGSTEFSFGDSETKSNFYTVSQESINSVFNKLSESDIIVLSSIIKDDKQNWGPINYKILDIAQSTFSPLYNFFLRLNDTAKYSVYYSSIRLLSKFGDAGLEELYKLNFREHNSSAQALLFETLSNPNTPDQIKSHFKNELYTEITKSEEFIEEFHTKYCSDLNKKCLVPSLEKTYLEDENILDNLQKLRLEFRRYRNSDAVQNFELSRYFLPLYPELKERLCDNIKANRLRGLYHRPKWQLECQQNGIYARKLELTIYSNLK